MTPPDQGEQIMDRAEIEALLNATYAARHASDVDGILAAFAPGASYRIAGDRDSCPIAADHHGEALAPAIKTMCGMFQSQEWKVTNMIIDGDKAAVTIEARFTFAPTGDTAETRIVDIWTFRDGLAVDVIEYADTAHLMRLAALAPPG
jgi:ketosteroid isomerase-like protein